LNTDTESELHTHARCRDYVGIPGTAGYLEVVDPVLFLGGLSKDMTKCVRRDQRTILNKMIEKEFTDILMHVQSETCLKERFNQSVVTVF
jgi:hypothetical protein